MDCDVGRVVPFISSRLSHQNKPESRSLAAACPDTPRTCHENLSRYLVNGREGMRAVERLNSNRRFWAAFRPRALPYPRVNPFARAPATAQRVCRAAGDAGAALSLRSPRGLRPTGTDSLQRPRALPFDLDPHRTCRRSQQEVWPAPSLPSVYFVHPFTRHY